MADLREKDDLSKIYVVLFMLHFKREHCLESAILVDFEQKNGPKSRKDSTRRFFAKIKEGLASQKFFEKFSQNG